MELQETKPACTCKDCLSLTTFRKDPTAKSVSFSFGSESRHTHYKTYQLPQITKGGFAHVCTISHTKISKSYSITVRRTKDQLAMRVEKGVSANNKREKPKASTPRKNKWYGK